MNADGIIAADTTTTPPPSSAEIGEALTPCPSSDSSAARSAPPMPPLSPPRPSQPHSQSLGSLPNTPAPPSSADRSPAVTPTPQQRMDGPVWAVSSEETGVVLGLEQLERQQDEAERRRREQRARATTPRSHQSPSPSPAMPSTPQSTPRRQYLDDDEHTAPSSTTHTTRDAASHTGDTSLGSGDDVSAKEYTKFEQMMKQTRHSLRKLSSQSSDFLRRRGSNDMVDPAEEDDEGGAVDAIIYGHLQKLGRNGKWQTRWFESDGECLSYYKSSKRTKLLATLDLEKAGIIVVNEDDPKGCSFTIQVLGRPYYLRAESRGACKDWVITLNRVKEAKLHLGNVKLVQKQRHILQLRHSPPDLLDGNVSTYTQGVVAHANRQRTRAVNLENIEEMMHKEKEEDLDVSDPSVTPAFEENESISHVVLARWQKRKTSMSKLATKLAKWARSVSKKYNCTDVENDVRLDRHVHPPGHDDPVARPMPKIVERDDDIPKNDPALSGWIGKETSLAVKAGPVVMEPDDSSVGEPPMNDPVSLSVSSGSSSNPEEDESETETRELS
ncbi:PH [Seminavis robusta]|uniref:PH n=1 Tax=Seminavis robusta TaxID=568900 RepID=A0A9N8DU64_9STRA|nr:PH [Seminavis robusta]|eukprot:Sro358_g125980.1 PH (556) ;mRNA; f:69153-70997